MSKPYASNWTDTTKDDEDDDPAKHEKHPSSLWSTLGNVLSRSAQFVHTELTRLSATMISDDPDSVSLSRTIPQKRTIDASTQTDLSLLTWDLPRRLSGSLSPASGVIKDDRPRTSHTDGISALNEDAYMQRSRVQPQLKRDRDQMNDLLPTQRRPRLNDSQGERLDRFSASVNKFLNDNDKRLEWLQKEELLIQAQREKRRLALNKALTLAKGGVGTEEDDLETATANVKRLKTTETKYRSSFTPLSGKAVCHHSSASSSGSSSPSLLPSRQRPTPSNSIFRSGRLSTPTWSRLPSVLTTYTTLPANDEKLTSPSCSSPQALAEPVSANLDADRNVCMDTSLVTTNTVTNDSIQFQPHTEQATVKQPEVTTTSSANTLKDAQSVMTAPPQPQDIPNTTPHRQSLPGTRQVLPQTSPFRGTFVPQMKSRHVNIATPEHRHAMDQVVEDIPKVVLRRADVIRGKDGTTRPNPFWAEIYGNSTKRRQSSTSISRASTPNAS